MSFNRVKKHEIKFITYDYDKNNIIFVLFTAQNLFDKCSLITINNDKEQVIFPFKKTKKTTDDDIFITRINISQKAPQFYFVLEDKDATYYYSNKGLDIINDQLEPFVLDDLIESRKPIFHFPEWIKDEIWYYFNIEFSRISEKFAYTKNIGATGVSASCYTKILDPKYSQSVDDTLAKAKEYGLSFLFNFNYIQEFLYQEIIDKLYDFIILHNIKAISFKPKNRKDLFFLLDLKKKVLAYNPDIYFYIDHFSHLVNNETINYFMSVHKVFTPYKFNYNVLKSFRSMPDLELFNKINQINILEKHGQNENLVLNKRLFKMICLFLFIQPGLPCVNDVDIKYISEILETPHDFLIDNHYVNEDIYYFIKDLISNRKIYKEFATKEFNFHDVNDNVLIVNKGNIYFLFNLNTNVVKIDLPESLQNTEVYCFECNNNKHLRNSFVLAAQRYYILEKC